MSWLKEIVVRFLQRHHTWRDIGYDELSELYIGMMFRSFALSIIGVFIPLYLLRLGYPVISIATMYAWHFTIRIAADYLSGHTIAAIGPKHTMLVSYLFQILTLGLFLTLPRYDWPLWALGMAWGVSNSLFWIAYHVDFSKIKHEDHGGKEVGVANIVMRVGYAAGPVIGGVLATLFGAQYAFLVATVILFLGIVPMLTTAEPVKLHRRLEFGSIRLRALWPGAGTFAALCLDDLANAFYWPLFLSLFVLGGLAYAELGAITTVSMLASVVAARILGQQTDRHRGRPLFQVGLLGVAAVYLFRPLVSSVRLVFGLNILYELFVVSYQLPFYKGLYHEADQYDERRIEFITMLEVMSAIMRAVICWIIVALLGHLDVYVALSLVFAAAAVGCCLGVLSERFSALD